MTPNLNFYSALGIIQTGCRFMIATGKHYFNRDVILKEILKYASIDGLPLIYPKSRMGLTPMRDFS